MKNAMKTISTIALSMIGAVPTSLMAPNASASTPQPTKLVTRTDAGHTHHASQAKAKIDSSALHTGKTTRVSLDTASGASVTTTLSPGASQNGFSTWSGKVDGNPNSQVVAIQSGSTTALSVTNGSTTTRVISAPGTSPVVTDVSSARVSEHDEIAAASASSSATTFATLAPGSASATSSGHIVTLKVLNAYTPAVARKAGGTAAINAISTLDVAQTNDALARSGTNVRLRVVNTIEAFPATGGSDSSTELTNLTRERTPGDGYYDEIQRARQTYQADAVMTYTDNSECGLAYVNKVPNADYMFGDLSWRCAGNGSYSHEFGHLLGATHDAFVTPASDPAYAHGYVDLAHGFRDIMSYPNACIAAGKQCNALPYYSNPNITYNGAALGSGTANAVRQFNEWAAKFSGSTDAAVSETFTPATGSSSAPSTVNPSITFSGPVSGINTSDLQLVDSSSRPVRSFVMYNAKTHVATIKPVAALSLGRYQIVVESAASAYSITDSAGREVANSISSFTVGQGPRVVSVSPSVGATSVSTYAVPSVTFNTSIMTTPMADNLFQITDITANTPVKWEAYSLVNQRTVSFSHGLHPFTSGHTYRMTISGWNDASGNAMTPYTSTFTVR